MLKNVFMFTAGVLSIFIVRLLAPAEYGKWALVYQLIATIGPILSLGFLSTLAKFIPEYTDEKRKNELFSQTLFLVTIAFLVFSLLYISGTSLFPKILPQEIKIVKYPFLFFIGALALVNLVEGFYRGLGKFNQWTIIDGGRSILSAGLAILLFLTLSKSFETVFYTYFFLIILFLITLLFHLRKNLNLNLNLNLEPQIIKFSLIMLAGQIVFLLGTTIDSVLLRALLKDPAQVGYYNAGIRIPKMLETMLLAPLSVPFLYYFSHPETGQSKEKILEFGSRMLGIIWGTIAILIFAFAKEIVLIFFGQVYKQSIYVLELFSLYLFFAGFLLLFSLYFISVNQPWKPILVYFISVVVICSLLNVLLIPHLKSIAPAINILVSLTIYSYMICIMASKQGIKCIKTLSMTLGCILASIVVCVKTNCLLSIATYFILIFLTGIFGIKDLETGKRILYRQY